MSKLTGRWACAVALAAVFSGCSTFHLKYKAEK